jgi:glyoxylase-like metal-dependent hydrolase (beta-lactamase superfamily II)
MYTITAVRLGTTNVDRAGLVYGVERGTRLDIPVWGAVIEGEGHRIIADTGFANPAKWSQYNPCQQDATQTIDAALAELGWRRHDIDVVINSHLHFDHSENNPAFGNAQFYVSQTEWTHAHRDRDELPWSYHCDWTGPEVGVEDYTLVNVDHFEVRPGITLIQTPGHTAGHQSILVETIEGTVCIAGDAACLMENISGPVATGVTISEQQSLASIEKIIGHADRILMNHDPGLTAFQQSDFPLIGDVHSGSATGLASS